jgi:excisionase family DNA binding protein
MEYLTTHQVGEILGVTQQRVLALIRDQRLPATKVGRDWLIARQDLDEFERHPQGNYKLTADQSQEIKLMVRDGTAPTDLAKQYNVTVRTIYRHIKK